MERLICFRTAKNGKIQKAKRLIAIWWSVILFCVLSGYNAYHCLQIRVANPSTLFFQASSNLCCRMRHTHTHTLPDTTQKTFIEHLET